MARPLGVAPEPWAGEPKLSVRGVTKTFQRVRGEPVLALDDVSFDVGPGEFVCLLGPSASGKSTVLNILAGLERPDVGEVLLDGHPVTDPGPDRTLLFQDPALFPW